MIYKSFHKQNPFYLLGVDPTSKFQNLYEKEFDVFRHRVDMDLGSLNHETKNLALVNFGQTMLNLCWS